MKLEEIEREVSLLSNVEKGKLFDFLIENIESNQKGAFEDLWKEEIEKRYENYLKGYSIPVPAEEVFRKLKELRKH
jgi:hypothetical protein